MDPNQPSIPTGQRRSVDGVRRTSGLVAQPQSSAPTQVAATPKPAKVTRRQVRKDTKQANKTAKAAAKASKAKPATVQPTLMPVPRKSRSGLKVFLQALLAIVVIVTVALVVVVLYVRYYQ